RNVSDVTADSVDDWVIRDPIDRRGRAVIVVHQRDLPRLNVVEIYGQVVHHGPRRGALVDYEVVIVAGEGDEVAVGTDHRLAIARRPRGNRLVQIVDAAVASGV